eukprot:GGOE01044150.1.p1 GENE.GGOE01044150.1~~GGOE01044150.1.p1  ORF type:complete len:319 (-),score=102.74 GGOE01044150.1:361-1287(-)
MATHGALQPRGRPGHLRVLAVQFDAALGERERNMAKAAQLLAPYTDQSGVDVVVLPEMAFTGYHFRDYDDVLPLAEGPGGVTEQWCRQHALRLRCTVFCGFPFREVAEEGADDGGQGEASSVDPLYNSMLVVGPDGTVLNRYHKHFLYVTDETWATPGPAFHAVTLPLGVKVGLGICMDINPCKFEAPWEAYEWANFCQAEGVKVLVLCSNWCTAHPDDAPEVKARPPNRGETLNYWTARLKPLIGESVHFVVADRVGQETLAPLGRAGVTTFCGSSCVISLRQPRLLAALNTTEEAVLEATIPIAGA